MPITTSFDKEEFKKLRSKAKKDEFYTQRSDIENELKHYKNHFRNKVVYCNCDDPTISNFFYYFSYNFKHLGVKKLITTCYKNQNPDLFSPHDSERAIMLEYDGFRDGDVTPRAEDIGIKELDGDGDFRGQECIELLKQSDIVVTNPPFSLFREYVAQLIEHKKRFLIIGTWNAVTYKNIFPLIMGNDLWIGINSNRNFSGFIVPEHYPLHGTEARVDENGNRIVSSNNTCWFTNLDHDKRHEEMILTKRYTPEEHPHYDNYDAIEVGQTKNIPENWEGVMGVPITFLNKHNPEQFEIVGIDHDVKAGLLPDIINPEWEGKTDRGYVCGKRLYSRIFIRNRKPEL